MLALTRGPIAAVLILIVIVLAVSGLYARSLGFPFVVDDFVQIAENPAVTEGVRLDRYFLDRETSSSRPDYNTRIFRPLRNVAFRALAVGFGMEPVVFRAANLVLFAAAIALIFALGRRLMASAEAALVSAALFAIMPVHVEPVVYASALGDLLSLDLELAGLYLGLLACRRDRGWAWRAVAAVVCLALAMTAKEMALTGPALLALLLVHRSSALSSRNRAVGLLGALGVVSLGYLALRTHVVGQVGQEAVTAGSVLRGLTEAPALLLGYLTIALMPFGHRPTYVVAPPAPAVAILLWAAFAGVWWCLRRIDRRAPATQVTGFATWFAWFVVALLPVLHLVPLWADLADRFVLVSTVGLAFAAGDLFTRLRPAPGLSPASARRRRLLWFPVGLLALVYTGSSFVEQAVWQNDDVLWAYAVEAEPDAPLAQANFCLSAMKRGQYPAALAACDRAKALGRDTPEIDARRASILQALERLPEAAAAARLALSRQPDQVQMHALLGDLALSRGELTEAAAQLAHAHRLHPRHPSTLLLDARLARQEGRLADALILFEEVTRVAPGVARFEWFAIQAAQAARDDPRRQAHCAACLKVAPDFGPCLELCAARAAAP